MARIVHSPAAEDDLLEIWLGLAANNVSAAENLMDDLDVATRLLATQPLIGKARREFGAGIRSFPVRDYVIVYRPILGGVELVRVVHGARDLERVLSWRVSEEVATCCCRRSMALFEQWAVSSSSSAGFATGSRSG